MVPYDCKMSVQQRGQAELAGWLSQPAPLLCGWSLLIRSRKKTANDDDSVCVGEKSPQRRRRRRRTKQYCKARGCTALIYLCLPHSSQSVPGRPTFNCIQCQFEMRIKCGQKWRHIVDPPRLSLTPFQQAAFRDNCDCSLISALHRPSNYSLHTSMNWRSPELLCGDLNWTQRWIVVVVVVVATSPLPYNIVIIGA